MQLSLAEAATLLGKLLRQVRYMIKCGQLEAAKVDGRWLINEAAIPLTAAQRGAIETRAATAREAFERRIGEAGERRRLSRFAKECTL